MLTKEQIKGCLAGAPTPVVPALFHWYDGKFIEQNREAVEELQRQYENDYTGTGGALTLRAETPALEPGEFIDEWGCRFKAAPDGVGAHPTAPIVTSLAEWRRYADEQMPLIEPDIFTDGPRNTVSQHSDSYVAAHFWRTFYERMYMLIGFENLMMEIATEGELFKALLADLRDFTIRGIELLAGTGVDAVFLADDWGTQHRLQISPESWRRHFGPAYAAMIETAHANGLDVWFHSCGHVSEIIPDWIDIGLDVLAHLQAAALDLPAIAKACAGRMTFFGGIDVQFNLVHGTRESIREEVKALMDDFHAHDGRFIASPSNSIMPETPIDNVRHLFEAIREFGGSSQSLRRRPDRRA